MPKRAMSQVAAILLSIALVFSPGCMSMCGTFGEFGVQLEPMAGSRIWLGCATGKDPNAGAFAIYCIPDLPFSFALDIALLPITVPVSLVKWILTE